MDTLFQCQYLGVSLLEWVGVALGLLNVWLIIRQKVANWPVGLAMVSLYFVVFLQQKLYANVGLQAGFFVLQVYGWRQWRRGAGDGGAALEVARLTVATAWRLAAITLTGAVALTVVLARFTADPAPAVDSAIGVLSLVAQWMMAKKILEHWGVWVAVDVLSVGVCLYTGLYATAALYAVFLILCLRGFHVWRRSWVGRDIRRRPSGLRGPGSAEAFPSPPGRGSRRRR